MVWYDSFSKWWRKWGCWILLLLVIAIIVWAVFIADKKYEGGYTGISAYTLDLLLRRKKKRKQQKKHETRCREIFEKIYKCQFRSIRPDFLRYKNNKNLE